MNMQLIKDILGFKNKATDASLDEALSQSPIMEQISYERMVYLEIFSKELDSLDHRKINYETEKVIKLSKGKKVEPLQLARVDAVHQEGKKALHEEANIANPAPFETMKEVWDDIEVTLNPIVWNAVDFNVVGDYPNIEQLENWYKKWFDIKGRNKPDAKKMHNVVHKLSKPEQTADGWSITVDFGSAEMEAFIALFKQCRFNWARSIDISSQKYFDKLAEAYDLTNNMNNATITTDNQPI